MPETLFAPGPLFSPLDPRKTVSSREVAERLGIDIRTVQKYVRDGILVGFQPRGRRGGWRIRRDLLEKWWAETTGSKPDLQKIVVRRNRRKKTGG